MNQAQRIAALILRLAGFAVLVVGLMGLLYVLLVRVRLGDLSGLPGEALWSALARVFLGLLLIGLGKRIGEWLGKGLE
jgi:hypothetical protein